jgi:hypothetical protein
MTAARRLVADVGVREHRDGTSENRANGIFSPKESPAPQGVLFGLTLRRRLTRLGCKSSLI